MKRLGLVVALSFACVPLLLAAAGSSGRPGAEAVLYYDRGHYWIELAFRGSDGRDTIPPGLSAEDFEITRIGSEEPGFRPSRVEEAAGGGRRYVILSSSRFEGRSCYRVVFAPPAGRGTAVDSICDPFGIARSVDPCRSGPVSRAVASLFAQGDDPWRLNVLSYEYDLSRGRSSARLAVEPRLRARGWTIDGALRIGESGVAGANGSASAVGRRTLCLSVSKGAWSHGMRFSTAAACRLDRLSWEEESSDSSLSEMAASIEWRVRFDDLLDRWGGTCMSVFKGIEAAFGYEWHGRAREGPANGNEFERIAPFILARGTWTAFGTVQLSFAVESHGPGSISETFVEFHSLRARLLLRDALERPAGRSHHPDVELAWDTGRRPPLFFRESRVSLGFVFGLYPW